VFFPPGSVPPGSVPRDTARLMSTMEFRKRVWTAGGYGDRASRRPLRLERASLTLRMPKPGYRRDISPVRVQTVPASGLRVMITGTTRRISRGTTRDHGTAENP
jgi:hypothetical protein